MLKVGCEMRHFQATVNSPLTATLCLYIKSGTSHHVVWAEQPTTKLVLVTWRERDGWGRCCLIDGPSLLRLKAGSPHRLEQIPHCPTVTDHCDGREHMEMSVNKLVIFLYSVYHLLIRSFFLLLGPIAIAFAVTWAEGSWDLCAHVNCWTMPTDAPNVNLTCYCWKPHTYIL